MASFEGGNLSQNAGLEEMCEFDELLKVLKKLSPLFVVYIPFRVDYFPKQTKCSVSVVMNSNAAIPKYFSPLKKNICCHLYCEVWKDGERDNIKQRKIK